MSLAPCGDLRDNVGMTPDLIVLFLQTSLFHALTFAAVMSTGFPHPKTPIKVVGTAPFALSPPHADAVGVSLASLSRALTRSL